ncbi:uncharacterized protein LOC117177795 [Belonocnema kinseyi]|uniref:uncharacterized protein LOC117177795 n=1 Tax=Belonocnema kinseyi TaxID=2817044 RepID=UPI00143DD1AD|nr:uncharacterized protein LOC117177795 [Belonocnema kinseyi]
MSGQIQRYIEGCPTCANKHNEKRIRDDAVIIEAAKLPFKIINVDKFTYEGRNFLLLEDSLTRYVWVTPLKTEEVYTAMYQFLPANPTPAKNITDNEPTFQSKKLEVLFRYLGIQQIKISANHPESNGIEESVIKTFKRLTYTVDDNDPTTKLFRAIHLAQGTYDIHPLDDSVVKEELYKARIY